MTEKNREIKRGRYINLTFISFAFTIIKTKMKKRIDEEGKEFRGVLSRLR